MTIEEFLQVFDISNIDTLYINNEKIYSINSKNASTHFSSVYIAFTTERIDTKYINSNVYIPNGYKINTQLHFKTK